MVGIYCRESTEKQEIETLVSLCIKEAEKLGYKEYKVYKDIESGYSNTRSEYLNLLEDIKKGYVDTLILYESSRLTRDELEHQLVFKLFKEKKIKIYTVTHGWLDLTNEDDLFLTSLLNLLDAREGRKTAARVRDRMKELCQNGYWTGGAAPYGYKLVDKKLVLVEEEAIVVKEVFNLFLQHFSRRDIARQIGLTSKDVRRMLVNPIYAGRLKYQQQVKVNGKVKTMKEYQTFKGIHTPIITIEEFEATQELIQKLVPDKSGRSSIFKGLLYCPCGKRLSFKKFNSKYKGKNYKGEYYKCGEYTDICLKSYIYEEHLYNMVITEIKKALDEIELDFQDEDNEKIKKNIELYKKNLKKIKKQKETLTRNLINELISQEIFEKLTREIIEKEEFYIKKIDELDSQIKNDLKKSDNKNLLKLYLQKIENEKNVEKLNKLFKILIDKIVFVNEFRINIYFNF